jgi:hypothetical protein
MEDINFKSYFLRKMEERPAAKTTKGMGIEVERLKDLIRVAVITNKVGGKRGFHTALSKLIDGDKETTAGLFRGRTSGIHKNTLLKLLSLLPGDEQ